MGRIKYEHQTIAQDGQNVRLKASLLDFRFRYLLEFQWLPVKL